MKKISPKACLRKGFTLVELAIVLVVIALLIVTITGAQRLIDSARANRIVTEMNQIRTNVSLFQANYGRLPADYNSTGSSLYTTVIPATVLGPTGGTAGTTGLFNGTANDLINEFAGGTAAANLGSTESEMRRFFQFLFYFLNATSGSVDYAPNPNSGASSFALPQSGIDSPGSKAFSGTSYVVFSLNSNPSVTTDTVAGSLLSSTLPNSSLILALITAPAAAAAVPILGGATTDLVANSWLGAVPHAIAKVIDNRVDGDSASPITGNLITVSPNAAAPVSCITTGTTAMITLTTATLGSLANAYGDATGNDRGCVVITKL